MNRDVEVFSSAQAFQEEELRGKTAVIIDVLRASSTITNALSNGARGVIPVDNMGAASKIAQTLDSPNYLLCGEKDGEKIEGYDLGNSPLEYTADKIKDKMIIFNTTNGTKALKRSSMAEAIYVGCFLNLETIVQALKKGESDIVLVCAGWRGRLSLEDLLCAGNIIYELTNGDVPENARDGAKVALGLYEKFGNDIESAVLRSNHAVRLKDIIGSEDVSYCCRLNELSILPVLEDGIISNAYGK